MSVRMIVTRQKVTKAQRKRRNHARWWRFTTVDARFDHIISDCAICDEIYEDKTPGAFGRKKAAAQVLYEK